MQQLLSRVILSTPGGRLLHEATIRRAAPIMEGPKSNRLIEQNELSCWIYQCGPSHHPPSLLRCYSQLLLFFITTVVTSYSLQEKGSKQPRLQLFIWPQATLEIRQQIPKHQGSFGSLIPFWPLFCKTKACAEFSKKKKIDSEACWCGA